MPHKMKRYISIIILMGLLLASCGQRPVSGYVVGKRHVTEQDIIRENNASHPATWKPVHEQWVVFVADSCRVTPCHVTKETFTRLRKGQFVTVKGFK